MKLRIFILTLIMLAISCAEPPKPGKQVSFETFCTSELNPVLQKGLSIGQRVSLDGYLGLSDMFSLQSDTLMITLFSDPERSGSTINVSIKVGTSKNNIESLNSEYKYSDLKVMTNTGKIMGPDSKVRIHGERLGESEDNSCYLGIDLIEEIN